MIYKQCFLLLEDVTYWWYIFLKLILSIFRGREIEVVKRGTWKEVLCQSAEKVNKKEYCFVQAWF